MAEQVLIELEMPYDLERFTLPDGVEQRLQSLLISRIRAKSSHPMNAWKQKVSLS